MLLNRLLKLILEMFFLSISLHSFDLGITWLSNLKTQIDFFLSRFKHWQKDKGYLIGANLVYLQSKYFIFLSFGHKTLLICIF